MTDVNSLTFISKPSSDRYGFKVESQHFSRTQWKKFQENILKEEKKMLQKWEKISHNGTEFPPRSDRST
jgi:hypothetical protein